MTSLLSSQEDTSVGFHVAGASVDDALVVTLAGEVDVACQEQVSEFVRLEVEACPGTLVIDMARVTFVDSTGLSMLVKAHRTVAAKGGRVVVRSPNEQFRRLLRLTGVDALIAIEGGT